MTVQYDTWPFHEAQAIVDRLTDSGDPSDIDRPEDDPVIFETGFGPSGLPHIGTFAEVARTTWVQRAFEELTGHPTKLIVFSDDMDGLRKVPENVPKSDMLLENLGRPLCDVPDPFEEEESFSAYMNARLREFLETFGFDYEFRSSQDQYHDGVFDDGLERILEHYEEVRQVIVPTLREWRRDRWSPFFPKCENCGKVYTTRVTDVHPDDGTISYVCDNEPKGMVCCEHEGRVAVTGGQVKVGWKVDWALRWYTFGVDYEMYGKDLIESADLSGDIVEVLGGDPPAGFFYEMFLDEDGKKISKSVGTGLTIDEWLAYGPLESLGWFIFQNPQKATKLHFDVIPDSVDKWLEDRRDYGRAAAESDAPPADHSIWFIERDDVDAGDIPSMDSEVDYSMILNLVGALNTDDRDMLWNYLTRYDEDARGDEEVIEPMLDGALQYYRDFILPTKEYRTPGPDTLPAVRQFRDFLADYDGDSAEEIQEAAYEAGKSSDAGLGDWFQAMYRLLLGQDRGPRLGTFVEMFGVSETVETIDERLSED